VEHRQRDALMARRAEPDDRQHSPLRRTALRNFLPDADLARLARLCRTVTRKAGATVFRQGDPSDALWVVIEGTVELRARPPGRRVYRTVELIGVGCTFGGEAVFGEKRYLFGARALEPASLLALSRTDFERLARSHAGIAVGVVQCAGSCLVETVRRATVLTQAPADVALHHLLRQLARRPDRPDGSSPIRITHAQLAGMLHLSRETVSRLLSRMAADGTIELGRGTIRVRRT
jgi:CRP-like cAMP-binding protein